MDVLVILRPEIFSVVIMSFLIVYDRYCAKLRNESHVFLRFSLVCLAHCIMALVTEITVNLKSIPAFINNLCHILFFASSLLYSLFYLEYVVSLVIPKGKLKKRIMAVSCSVSFIALIIMMFSPIIYITGTVTKYSAGIGANLCYVLGFIFFVTADLIMIINYKHIRTLIIGVLIPLSSITIVLLFIQVLLPEFLYSAQALTLLTVGIFFAIENPVGRIKDRAFIDFNIHMWNRNGYDFDLTHKINEKIRNGSRYTCVMADINGLKRVNDSLGHLEGDRLIETIAKSLHDNMTSAYKIYRMGGDEFLALYFDADTAVVESELEKVSSKCSKINLEKGILAGVSIGYATGESDNIDETFKKAEKMMYKNKQLFYEANGLERRKN